MTNVVRWLYLARANRHHPPLRFGLRSILSDLHCTSFRYVKSYSISTQRNF